MNKHIKALLITFGIVLLCIIGFSILIGLIYYCAFGVFIVLVIISISILIYGLYIEVLEYIDKSNSHRH